MTAPDLDPDLLKAFLAVAEHGSFTRAADRLNRTQSAVSVQVRRLEERLATKLFQRDRTGVVPTAAGHELLAYAQRILALHAEAVGALRARKAEAVIRLGVMDDYGTIVIPPLLASFAREHPTVRVEIETGLTATMPARLGEAYDLVIAMHPQGRGDASCCGASRPSGRPPPLATPPQRRPCPSRSIRLAACFANGPRRPSIAPAGRGGSPLSAGPWRRWNRSRRRALRSLWSRPASCRPACALYAPATACRRCPWRTSASIAHATCRARRRCLPIICSVAFRNRPPYVD
ncbi:LysR family transcriptional regulator [Bradyrhizobium rifense]|uniref:LysR family transcriptional regulator n=1 Tax=Bradyrhizobium rifense TaxID=515499 RepID=UPI003D31D8BE